MNKTTAYDADVLYRIKKTTAGKYSFESVASSKKQSTTAAGIKSTGSETKVDKISSERVTLSDDTSLNIASNVVIYTYDISADKTTVSDYSSRLDLISEDVNNVTFYKNVDSDSDNYGLVDYIVIYQK